MHQKTHSYVPNPHATLETPGAATAEPGEEVICSTVVNVTLFIIAIKNETMRA